MKIVIDIPEKTNAHIRSDYGHGMKCLLNNDVEILCDAIYHCSPYEERLLGEWRVHSHCSDGFSYKCSLCGRVVNSDYWFEQKEILSVYPYCHCGAKMVAVEDPIKWYFGLGKSDDVTDVKYIKVGNVIYTQDDDKQGWTGKEENK